MINENENRLVTPFFSGIRYRLIRLTTFIMAIPQIPNLKLV